MSKAYSEVWRHRKKTRHLLCAAQASVTWTAPGFVDVLMKAFGHTRGNLCAAKANACGNMANFSTKYLKGGGE